MKKEIGSEFCKIETISFDKKFFVSGRTALEFIIRDILSYKDIKVVHMPSYCCHTMIEPFLRHSIKIEFYDVYYENGVLQAQIPDVNSEDIFFYINYFGYKNQNMGKVEKIRESACIIIEDATHSWMSDECNAKEHMYVDYRFVSYRKWTGFTGISVAEKNGTEFIVQQKNIEHCKYDSLRKSAQIKKAQFLQKGEGNKQEFLENYGTANKLLKEDYIDYQPSHESMENLICLDKKSIRALRRKNAQILIDVILHIKEVQLIFDELQEFDVPLNVPILVDESIRDDFRKYLIAEQIYCPVHWPLSDFHESISERSKDLYRRELSLVCDQRYASDDMERFAKCIKTYFEGNRKINII